MLRRGQHCRQHLANTPLHLLVLSQPRLCYFWYTEHEGVSTSIPKLHIYLVKGVTTDVALCEARWDPNCVSNKAQKLCKSIYPFARLMNHTCRCLEAPRYRGMVSGRKIILTEMPIF